MTVFYNPQIVTDSLELCIDPANFKSYSPNVMPNPIDNFAWCGTASINTGTISRDTSINRSPAGGIPLKLVSTGTDAYIATYNNSIWNLAPAAQGQTWTMSFWAKASSAATALPYLFSANSSGTYLEAPSSTFSVTTFWQRFSFSATFSNASTAFVQARLGCTTNGATIWFDGIQVERASSMTNFSPVTNVLGGVIYNIANSATVASGNLLPASNPPTYSANPSRLVFNGSSQFMSFGNVFNIPTTGLSCFSWVNQTNVGSAFGPIVAKRNSSGVGWSLTINYSGQLLFNYGNTSVPLGSGIVSNTWYYVGFTISGSGELYVYINGIQYGPGSFTVDSNTIPFYIGLFNESLYLSGSRGHTTVYTKVLSSAEVLTNYNATKSRY